MIHFVLHDARDIGGGGGGRGRQGRHDAHRLDHGRGPHDQGDGQAGHPHRPQGGAQGASRRATPSSSTASTSARSSPPSRRASTPTSTTSRPSAGKRSQRHMTVLTKDATPSSATGARTAASACATTSSSCRWTTCPTRRPRPWRTTSRARWRIPHPYGRLQFGADLDLHFRTLIGTGSNPNVAAVVVIGIEDGWTQEGGRRHRHDRQAGGRLRHRAARRPRHHHARLEGGARSTCSGRRELQREECPLNDLWVSHQVRRVRHDLAAAAPTRPSATPSTSCTPLGATLCLRRDHRAHRRRAHRRGALRAPTRCASSSCSCSTATRRSINRHKTSDLSDSPADQGQHRRRPDHDRGKGARQHPEDRQEVHGRRRDRQGRGADRARACGSWTRPRPRPRW